MNKKQIIKKVFYFIFMSIFLFSCNNKKNQININKTNNKKNIAISFPTKNFKRWNDDGNYLRDNFINMGHDVSIIYADNNISHQFRDVKELMSSSFDLIIISAIDENSLSQVLNNTKEKKPKMISYDNEVFNTSNIDYNVLYDDFETGKIQAEYVENSLDLKNNNSKKFNIEFFLGDENDKKTKKIYDGLMSILKKYIDDGTLNILSKEIDFDDITITNSNTATAMTRMQNILDTYYIDDKLDAVICANDNLAEGVINAIDTSYNFDNNIIITGEGGNLNNLNFILNNKQSMTVFNSHEEERNVLLSVSKGILENVKYADVITDSNINYRYDVKNFNNNSIIVPTYIPIPIILEKNNIKKELSDSKDYKLVDNNHFEEITE